MSDPKLRAFLDGVLNSYAQVFFSKNKWLAVIILAVTFLDWSAGTSALLMVLLTQALFRVLGLDQAGWQEGLYGLNSLLVGLCLANFYTFNLQFVSLLGIASLLSCFITVWLVRQLGKSQLPFLSLPFLITTWILLLAVRDFSFLSLSEKGVFVDNERFALGGLYLVQVMNQVDTLELPVLVQVYFRSLGAIFFQSSWVAGVLLGIGLLLFSRIAFVLSLLGFAGGYAYMQFVGDDLGAIHYGHIGFNFILSSIALAGFFLIPNRRSILFGLAITPLIAVMNSALSSWFAYFQLPIYSLPFNIIVVLVLYVLHNRQHERHLVLTKVQYGSPEKNLYSYANYLLRFGVGELVRFQLPFYGKWRVSQGHDGEYTHQMEWNHAWDFDLVNQEGLNYRLPGTRLEHYHCFSKTIVAPAPGTVVAVLDGVKDNPVGSINQTHNWGNTVVIQHGPALYSQLSHLKENSILVKEGEQLTTGTPVGVLGNSGRSPYPHLHFQVQASPYIGSETLSMPLSHYLLEKEEGLELVERGIPKEGEQIGNIETDEGLRSAFAFIPGKTLTLIEDTSGASEPLRWKVKTNIATNQNYLHCLQTNSFAYFVLEDKLFYFTDYIGPKKGWLYWFYLSANKVLLGAYEDLEVCDRIPVHHFLSGWRKLLQDVLAPLMLFYQITFTSKCVPVRENFRLRALTLKTKISARWGRFQWRQLYLNLQIEEGQLQRITVQTPSQQFTARCIDG